MLRKNLRHRNPVLQKNPRQPVALKKPPEEEPEDLDPDKGKTPGDILDELTGQMKLF